MSRSLTLAVANEIIEGALEKGRALNLKPLSVAVLDAGGHLVAFQRDDRSATLRPQLAIGKAASSLGLGVSSRMIGEMASERPAFVGALATLAPLGVVPAAGGLLILDSDGETLGAVGVTGDTSDNDEICAQTGLAAGGFA